MVQVSNEDMFTEIGRLRMTILALERERKQEQEHFTDLLQRAQADNARLREQIDGQPPDEPINAPMPLPERMIRKKGEAG